MKTMILAAAAVLTLGVGPAAYAGEGNGGASRTGLRWQARNGNATVPATEWFAATPAQREVLSPTYDYRGLRWSAAHSPPIATEIPNQPPVAARAQIHQAMPTALVRSRPAASMRWGQGAAAIISQ
jgi:hypothetical protein